MRNKSQSSIYVLMCGIFFILSSLFIVLNKNNVSFVNVINYSFKELNTVLYNTVYFLPNFLKNYTDKNLQIENLLKENSLLKEEIAKLNELTIKINVVEKTLEEFKNALGYKSNASVSSIIMVKPIFNNFSSIKNTIYVNAGSNQNIEPNTLVVSQKGVIGYIKTVFKNYSEVLLLTDDSFKLSAYTEETKYNIIVSGNLSNHLNINVYAENYNLKEGEKVYTNGFSGNFISNIPIGELYFYKDQWLVKPFDDLSSVQFLYIVK